MLFSPSWIAVTWLVPKFWKLWWMRVPSYQISTKPSLPVRTCSSSVCQVLAAIVVDVVDPCAATSLRTASCPELVREMPPSELMPLRHLTRFTALVPWLVTRSRIRRENSLTGRGSVASA
ncbi:hypothetical protein HRbin27_00002 [bacterium HR27]|nr:hypothetical protein HRbin27_00002 [bacterium HR27]